MKTLLTFLSLVFVASASALNVGDEAPDFRLKDPAGKEHALSEMKGKIVVLEWTNPGCPYVKKHYNSGFIQKLQGEAVEKGVVWFVVNSTNSEHGDFIPEEKRQNLVLEKNMRASAYLTDADGAVGKLYGAKTTPHMFVVNAAGKVAYQGAIDDAPMGDPAAAENYISAAIDALQAGKEIAAPETKPYGCSVKY